MTSMLASILFALLFISAVNSFTLKHQSTRLHQHKLQMASVGTSIPSGIKVDLIEPSSEDEDSCAISPDPVDLSQLVKGKKVVLFAVPGAFTPTCSEKHLPGFISLANEIRSRGVDDIYCLSVNDKYVMKFWGLYTNGFLASGIKLIADGNAELTQALGFGRDASGSRMGMRSKRYAIILDNGVISNVNVDEKGMVVSSAENILKQL